MTVMLMLAPLLPGMWVLQNKSNPSTDCCTLLIVALESMQVRVWLINFKSTISFSHVIIETLEEMKAGFSKLGPSQAAAESCTLQAMVRLVPT